MSGQGWWVPAGSELSLPVEESFAADVAAYELPPGWVGVALIGLCDSVGDRLFVVGYDVSGSCSLIDDAWVGAGTRAAVARMGGAMRVDPSVITAVYAVWRRSDGAWKTRLEAYESSQPWEVGLPEAVMMAQDVRSWLEESPPEKRRWWQR